MSESSSAGLSGSAPPSRVLSLPASRLGRWSMWLVVVFIALFVMNVLVISPLADDAGGRVEFAAALMPAFAIAMLLTGFSAGVIGLVSIIRHRERSWIVWLALIVTVLITWFVLGEILVPH